MTTTACQNSGLYQAILARRSVRRYARDPLGADILERVGAIVAGAKPLLPDNDFAVLTRDVAPGEDLAADLGAYGRLVTPPHYLLPYGTGEEHVWTDLGYRVEQVAVRLTELGIGTCYVGCLAREEAVRARFGLPETAHIGAFLVFGYPATSVGGRAVNSAIRRVVGAVNRLPPERIFFQGSFEHPARPDGEIASLIEAARATPSADNAQPWRFLWLEGMLYLFVRRHNRRYGPEHHQAYRYYDGGICMGNLSLALEALGRAGHWTMLDGEDPLLPDCPPDLEPLAKLTLA
jgi:nitroreductase